MLLSSQTSRLMKTAEEAKKYAPVFREAGFSALDYNFDVFFSGAAIPGTKRFELLDRPHEEYLAYFTEIADIARENGLVIGQTHAHFSTLIAAGNKGSQNHQCSQEQAYPLSSFVFHVIYLHVKILFQETGNAPSDT